MVGLGSSLTFKSAYLCLLSSLVILAHGRLLYQANIKSHADEANKLKQKLHTIVLSFLSPQTFRHKQNSYLQGFWERFRICISLRVVVKLTNGGQGSKTGSIAWLTCRSSFVASSNVTNATQTTSKVLEVSSIFQDYFLPQF